ncbi:MAG: hypothetical protein QOK04_874 [Solirubrobacteraceae bacterium]|nr:hypothetical protein [Solirubrobacteraceae bacterium]
MQTASHAYWTWRLARDRPHSGPRVLGAVAPDLPAVGLGIALSARGVSRDDLLDQIYLRPAWRWVHLAAHSLLSPAALLAVARRHARAHSFAAGWIGHLLVDYLSHHTDAWPPLWPLSRRDWPSPVSYWEPSHHARLWSATEAAAVALAALTEHRPRRRLLGAAAWAMAGAPALLGRGRDLWTALGYEPETR